MSDKEIFDTPSDDNEYDDALDESFEFSDDDYDDVDLDLDYEADNFESDDSAYDDEWQDEGQIDQEAVDNFQPKKSKISFNAIVIAGAVVVGIFVLISQVQPEPPKYGEVEKSKFTTALKMEGAFVGPGAIEKEEVESVEVPSNNKSEDKKEGGFLFDTDMVDTSKEVVPDTPPMPSPIISEANEVDEPGDKNIDDVLIKSVESDISETQQVPRSPLDEDSLSAAEGTQVVDENKTSIDSQQIVAESEMVSEKSNTDVIIEDSTKEVVEQIAVSESLELTSLNNKLDSIIQRLDGVELKINDFQESYREKVENITADIDAIKRGVPKAGLEKKADVKKLTAIQAQQTKKEVHSETVAVVKKTIKKKVPAKDIWELRAAQPGKAWVSKKGQRDMRPIVVGDKLSGIGRIQNILYSNGKWTVQGTLDKITQ